MVKEKRWFKGEFFSCWLKWVFCLCVLKFSSNLWWVFVGYIRLFYDMLWPPYLRVHAIRGHNLQLSRGEICVANFIPPLRMVQVWVFICVLKSQKFAVWQQTGKLFFNYG